jgi:hypothetical protein
MVASLFYFETLLFVMLVLVPSGQGGHLHIEVMVYQYSRVVRRMQCHFASGGDELESNFVNKCCKCRFADQYCWIYRSKTRKQNGLLRINNLFDHAILTCSNFISSPVAMLPCLMF